MNMDSLPKASEITLGQVVDTTIGVGLATAAFIAPMVINHVAQDAVENMTKAALSRVKINPIGRGGLYVAGAVCAGYGAYALTSMVVPPTARALGLGWNALANAKVFRHQFKHEKAEVKMDPDAFARAASATLRKRTADVVGETRQAAARAAAKVDATEDNQPSLHQLIVQETMDILLNPELDSQAKRDALLALTSKHNIELPAGVQATLDPTYVPNVVHMPQAAMAAS